MNWKLIILLGITLTGVFSNPVNDNKVGCVVCHEIDNSRINVHLIPHSHDDMGWLKTVDQYYFGMNTSIQAAGVQYIITSVYEALLENPDRRFIQVETGFFWKWWKQQSVDTQTKYKRLVDNGQIEMVNGAWVMNDEACVNYQSTIDQFTWGLRTLDETVGDCGKPRVGWQIDPFGHSREQASLLAQLGYDGVMFARLDHDDKDTRKNHSSLDFAWQGSQNLDNSVIFGSIFTTDLYNPPNGFCFNYKCGDDSIDDDINSAGYNVPDKVKDFVSFIKANIVNYPTKHIIIPMGGDFQYEAAQINYANIDRLIKAFENHTDLKVIYSTPSCYIKAVNEVLATNLTLKTDDFFPYSNDDHSFWAGYFSSRPNSKRFERIGHNILQVTKQLLAQNSYVTNKTFDNNLQFLREVMGILQHHDAITGTEQQHVANDYVRRLSRGLQYAENGLGKIIDELVNNTLNLNLLSCILSNITICPISQESDQFVVVVYNPLAWQVTHYIRLPVEKGTYEINGNAEPYDLIPVISNFTYVDLKEGKPGTHELVFTAKNIPPLGLQIYHIKKTSNEIQESSLDVEATSSAFEIDAHTNLIKSVNINGLKIALTQNFGYYYSETGENDNTSIASGAYLFRPTKTEPETLNNVEVIYNISGKIVDEVHQKWSEDAADVLQIIRWYKNEDYLEFNWIVGNIDIEKEKQGKEFISKFTINDAFDNSNVFYTDSNGREMIKRTKDSRPDYTYNTTNEPVAANYYPVSSKIVIKDEKNNIEVAVLTDRSQGGASLKPYEVELMVHRRILYDDAKGVGENLNETEFGRGVYVRGSHYLITGKTSGNSKDGKTIAALERILAQKKLVQPWVGLAKIDQTYEELKNNYNLIFQGLEKSLPENVNILTFEPWTEDEYLLRLEHIMEKNEDENLSKPVTVDIANAFKHFQIVKMTETTLGANELLSSYKKRSKYTWKTDKPYQTKPLVTYGDGDVVPVTLGPMQIRTFIVKLGEKIPHPSPSFGVVVKPVISLIMFIAVLVLGF